MSGHEMNLPEATRLEQLWSGEFGNAYVERNSSAGQHREPFWSQIVHEFPARRVLEVGCNLGANLGWISKSMPPGQVYGVDVNPTALRRLRQEFPDVNTLIAPARDLPFRDAWFDLVFTMGVLIHQPESTLPLCMAEIMRCSRQYILCGEYFAPQTTEVRYRDQSGALFKRNYGFLYQELFPELRLRKQGFLGRDDGWDDITYWIFEKP